MAVRRASSVSEKIYDDPLHGSQQASRLSTGYSSLPPQHESHREDRLPASPFACLLCTGHQAGHAICC